jgi:class 3 adenylate cyclase
MRDVVDDFGGRKIRYVGDAIHAVLAEGTAHTTDETKTVSAAVTCAGALRDAFEIIRGELPETRNLGIAIGVDLGPVSITRLGVRGTRDRCTVGRTVVGAEQMQSRCNGLESAINEPAHSKATSGIQGLLPAQQPTQNVTYNAVVATLEMDGANALEGIHSAPPGPAVHVPRAHV